MTKTVRSGQGTIEIEVIELDSSRSPAVSPKPQPMGIGRGPRWLIWAALALVVALGLALLPGVETEPNEDASLDSLAEPVIATTSTTLAIASQAVMSEDTFALIPVSGLDGFVQLAGPVEFDGKQWIAANRSYPSAEVTILSSRDGFRWEAEASVLAGNGEWLRIDDIASYGGVLMAVGASGRADGPEYAPSTSGSVMLWKSADGLRWSALPITNTPAQEYSNLRLTTTSEEALITGYRSDAFDTSILEQIPPELIPGLERGDFSWWYDFSSIRVVAPPGIELFWMPAERARSSGSPDLLFRSDNLIVWEELPANFSTWNVSATFDGGLVSNTYDGHLMYSTDGRSWDRTDRFPPAVYQTWGDRLVGLDYSTSHPELVVVDGAGAGTITLPAEFTEEADRYPGWVTPGPSGLAIVLARYGTYTEPIAEIDGYLLHLDNGALRIEEPSGETSYAGFDNNGVIKGDYDAETDMVSFESVDGTKSFEFPVASLLDLRGRSQRGRFDVVISQDGLVWAEGQTGLLADQVEILGSAGQAFLVGLSNFGPDYHQNALKVYLTGPAG